MADEPLSPPNIPDNDPDAPPRRKVYQPTLFAERRRRRASPWVVFPLLLAVLVFLLYFLLTASHRVRFVATAGEIVYTSDSGSPGIPHLWIARFDGSGARRLLTGNASEMQPAFAPSGSRLAFVSNQDGQVNQVFVVDGDGKNLAELTRSAGDKSHPAWSPSSSGTLGYTAGGALYEMPVGGEGAAADRILPPAPKAQAAQSTDQGLSQGPTISVASFAWSPAKNGGLAAVEDAGEAQGLAVSASASAAPTDVRETPQGNAPLLAGDTLSLGWNPDGSLLAVAALGIRGLPGSRAGSGIMLFEPDGSVAPGQPPLTIPNATLGPQNPVFSPDGTQIVFELWSEPNLAGLRRLGLFLVPVDASAQPRPLFRGDASEAAFAPDGSAIFFLAARPHGGHDLCRVAPDGTGFRRLTQGPGDVTGFSVSPQSAGH